MLYDSYTPDEDGHTYREMLLTDSEQTSRAIRLFRPSSWAVWAVRDISPPVVPGALMQPAGGRELLLVCTPAAKGLHRYDRIIIARRGEGDDIGTLVDFFRQELPQILVEKRLFLANIPVDLSPEGVEQAVGAAMPIPPTEPRPIEPAL